ncbi:hypothetical protein HDV03_002023 [Kappamyces sp. JEL0829]|nr:hypothetical protein HDV03_002023 [Kappamyces sp. JEL0829]
MSSPGPSHVSGKKSKKTALPQDSWVAAPANRQMAKAPCRAQQQRPASRHEWHGLTARSAPSSAGSGNSSRGSSGFESPRNGDSAQSKHKKRSDKVTGPSPSEPAKSILKKKSTKLILETTPPPQEGNTPALWIRSVTGAIKLIDAPAAVAPSAIEPQEPPNAKIAVKKRGKTRNDSDMAAFEKQQAELAKRSPNPLLAQKTRKSFYKPTSADAGTPIYATFNVDDVLTGMPMIGVKISLDQSIEPSKMKEEDIAKTLLAQTMQLEKDKEKRHQEKEVKKPKEEPVKKKEKAVVVPKKRVPLDHHTRHITHATYMFHLHQPNLMSPLFELPSQRQVLFGPLDSLVDGAEAKAWEGPVFRNPENVFLPTEVPSRIQIDGVDR